MQNHLKSLQCGAPRQLGYAKLVYNFNIYDLWIFMIRLTIVTGVYNPTFNVWVPHNVDAQAEALRQDDPPEAEAGDQV